MVGFEWDIKVASWFISIPFGMTPWVTCTVICIRNNTLRRRLKMASKLKIKLFELISIVRNGLWGGAANGSSLSITLTAAGTTASCTELSSAIPSVISFWFQEKSCFGWVARIEASRALKWSVGYVGELRKGRSWKPWWKFTPIMSFVKPHGSNYDLKKTLQAWREMCLALDIFGQGLFFFSPLAMLEHVSRVE